MVYVPGDEVDEALHAAHHNALCGDDAAALRFRVRPNWACNGCMPPQLKCLKSYV
jgi:hypothetical protein